MLREFEELSYEEIAKIIVRASEHGQVAAVSRAHGLARHSDGYSGESWRAEMNSSTHPYEQEEVMAYLDGELSADRAAGVAAHLRECAECAELAEQMRGVSVHLTNWSVEPAPASLTENRKDSEIGSYVGKRK